VQLAGEGLSEVAKTRKGIRRTDGAVFDVTSRRVAWNKTCHGLGLGVYERRLHKGLTIHDLRRSAFRNLIRAGVPRGVTMKIIGHKTEAVVEHYNITDAAEARDALVKVGQYAKLGGSSAS
jgi:hypothetical protein